MNPFSALRQRLFPSPAGPEHETVMRVAEQLVSQPDLCEPQTVAWGQGLTWGADEQAEWDRTYSRCSVCHQWMPVQKAGVCPVCREGSPSARDGSL